MNSIINFYKSLDTFNLILFWGVVIVIILLLSFSIIIANKNRKLKQLLISKNIEDDSKNNSSEDIPIVTNVIEPEINEPEEYDMKEPISIEENNFVAEEHVIDYNENKNTDIIDNNQYEPVKSNETKLYQRNVLRDISNQTSPIGIINRTNDTEKTIIKAEELNKSLHEEDKQNKNEEYLDEVSRKLSNAMSEIDRTEYELKQEEEAIISFKELMEKKDSIKIVDDENAVISIDELMKKKHEEEKLYNITKEEEDNQFIKELKNFRNDL